MSPLRIVKLLLRFWLEGLRRIAPAPHLPEWEKWRDDEVTGAWLGHSTVLINFYGVWIITDPVLATRCGLRFGPITIGPKRWVRPALTWRELPEIDLLLLSHSHMDHLDWWTIGRLRGKPRVVTAAGMKDLLARMPVGDVTELAWDESADIETRHGAVHVTARKVMHWGARMRTDDWRGYCGFLIERQGKRIGFAGDTARTSFVHWADGLNGSGIDLMIVPIGAYNPWITSHCNPEEAIAMAEEAGARAIVPVHHATFQLSMEPMDEPIARFRKAMTGHAERAPVGEIGETFKLP